MNWKSFKHLIQFILEGKIILKKMLHKIIKYFSQCTYILKGLVVLVLVIILVIGNLKNCLVKILHILLQVIICLNAQLSYHGNKTRGKLKGSCLKQSKITYTHGKIINIYIVFEIKKKFNISTYSTLKNCLFRAVSSTKNAYIVKYKYSGYRIGFQRP